MTALLGAGAAEGFRPSPVVPLPEQIRRQLVEAVARGDLRPGDRLPGEATLALQFRVSAAEVRAGLNSLMAMGLVEIVRGRHGGVRIAQPKPDLLQQTLHDGLSVLTDLSGVTLADLAEARRETETACARAAARRRTEDDLRVMREALERSAEEQLQISEWLALDIVFHRGVADASHNPILAMPLAAVHAVSQPRLNRLIADQLDRAEVHAQHSAIYRAIADRKPQAAALAVQHHVAYLEVRYARLAPESQLIG
jgi:GntR family transcriptional regulator, transcriptional repressor for pyruvate dehydrogenase complex